MKAKTLIEDEFGDEPGVKRAEIEDIKNDVATKLNNCYSLPSVKAIRVNELKLSRNYGVDQDSGELVKDTAQIYNVDVVFAIADLAKMDLDRLGTSRRVNDVITRAGYKLDSFPTTSVLWPIEDVSEPENLITNVRIVKSES